MRKRRRTHIAAFVFMVVFIILFSVVSGRFIYIQATGKVHNVSLIDLANEKRQTSASLSAERGKIYDNNGMVLSFDRPTYRVYAVVDKAYTKDKDKPLHVVKVEETAEKLAPLLNMESTEIREILEKGIKEERFQVEFGLDGKNLTQEVKKKIDALELDGINFTEESMRYYPNGMFASHIIGFARQDQETEVITGVTGIEKEMDKQLAGKEGMVSYLRDRYNRKLIRPNEVIQEPENGHDVYLTIDQKIQTLLEDVLSEVDELYSPERITATVMNPKTGEILALSNRPSYNPNSPTDVENWYNDVISTPIETGSTYKIFTWAAAIDAGVYNGSEQLQSGRYTVNEKVQPINDHNGGKGWGMISYDEGFARSSNVAASKLMWEKLGSDLFLEYLHKFDLDKQTGIDLPGEIAGTIQYDWPRDKLSTSFGQGSTVTAIQQLKAAAAIANEGKMMQPFVIKKIVNPDTGEIIEETKPEVAGQPISKATADQMIQLLDSVVNSEIGTGKRYSLEDYSVIGKTGTAEIPSAKGPGYLSGDSDSIYSFVGMAPKDDPELIMHVAVTRPNLAENQSGSEVVSFIFKNVMENGLHYLNIKPDKETEKVIIETKLMPEVVGKDTNVIEPKLSKGNFNFVIVGNGKKIQAANIAVDSEIYANQKIILITDKPVMPNISAWSKREVLMLASLLNVEVDFKGSGYVTSQSIEKDTVIKEGMKLTVELTPTD